MLKTGRNRRRGRPERRREERDARRRARVGARGPARRHWERRRSGQSNSAPELRKLPTGVEGLEDVLLGGGGERKEGAPAALRRTFRGIHPLSDERRYENQARGQNWHAAQEWAKQK